MMWGDPPDEHADECCESCLQDWEMGYTDAGELDGHCCCKALP